MRTRRSLPRRAIVVIVALAPLWLATPSFGESGWTVEFLVGIPFSHPSSVTIRQAGEPDLRHRPRFRSRPFDRPIYYAVRIGTWDGPDGWELELNHDKLYLSNPTREIERFDISHGFNRVTLNRAVERGEAIWRLGAGVVITHPENRVRGRPLSERAGILGTGYHLSGPTAMGSFGVRIGRRDGPFLPLEGMGTASWVRVPVADGDADLAVAGFHFLTGAGYGR
jgi:hypothetical protein